MYCSCTSNDICIYSYYLKDYIYSSRTCLYMWVQLEFVQMTKNL